MDVRIFSTSRATAVAAGDELPPADPQSSNQGEVAERIAQMACHVLVVDDDHVYRHGLVETLAADYDAIVEEAGDAHEARQKVAIGFFDVVLLDVQMPEVDGFKAGPMLRASGGVGHLVLMSSEPGYQDRALALGMQFLCKHAEGFTRSLEEILLHCRGGRIQ